MRRHRALGLAVVLVVVCLVPIAPSSLGLITPISVLAQDAGEPEAGAPTDLAVVALHCAEAPAADALTSYFATGTPPEACAPAVGVAIIVSENDAALPNSPFRTDVAGSLVVPVGLGSQVEVAEDAESLPDGYEPLIGEANSVPYANPVRLDEAVAGAAVLFVNVPAPVAALAQEAGEDVGAEDAASPAVSAAPETNGCDLAVPAAGDAAMLAPLPVPSAQGANITNTNTNTNTGIGSDPMSRARAPSDVAVASDPVRTSAGIWSWQSRQSSSDRLWRFDGSRADDWRLHGKGLWLWPGDHASDGARSLAFSGSSVRIGDGIWFLNWDGDQSGRWFGAGRFGTDHLAAASTGGGSRALVSNAVHIGDGVWRWPGHDRADDGRDHENDTWTWDDDRDRDHDWRMNDRGVWVRSGSFASSGNGSVAVSAHSVHIGPGIWFWPHDRHRADDWRWRARHRFDDWFVHGNGVWRWPGRIGIDHVAAARSGSGSLAIVASSVRIGGHGVWLLPPGHVGHGDDWRRPSHTGSGIWVLSTAIARSSSGTLAISSHAVRIDTGVWRLPSDRDRDHHWLSQGGHARGNEASIAPQAISANHDVESAPGKLEPTSSVEQPAPASGEEATAAAPLADPADSPGGDVGQPAVETADVVDNGGGAASDETVEAPTDMAASSSDVAPAAVDPAPVAPVAEPAPAAAPDAGYVAPGPVYSEPAAVEPATAPAADVPAAAPSAEPVYVAPAPDYVEPALEDPSAGSSGYVEPAFVEPAVDPGYVEPAVDPGFADPVVESPAGFAAEPGLDPVTGAPGAGAPNLGFADPGGNAGGGAPEPVTAVPDGGGPGLDGPVNAAPGIGHDGPGNGGTESIAPGNVEPTADMGPSGGDGEDE